MNPGNDQQFESLLQFLQQNRGFDFTGYKRPSLMRRVAHRIQMLNAGSFSDYADYLQVHPEEFSQLFNTILINVTAFFRDPPAWDFLRSDVVPAILKAKRSAEPVRVWSAGCASGEEAYSIAMLLAEAMEREEFLARVKVYATDVDDAALAQARLASYTEKDVAELDPALRERYFEAVKGRFVFRADLRRALIFGRNDLVQDAPISRLDLLLCRNTLMYFNAETQARALGRFHFALNGEGTGTGYLFLGRAEMMLSHGALFSPAELKFRVFEKVPQPAARQRAPGGTQNGNGEPMKNRMDRLRQQAVEETPVARFVIDADGSLVVANQRARTLFSLNPKDIGRPLQDLELSYRPVELRSLIEQAYAERRTVTQTSVERRFADGDLQYFDVVVAPVFDDGDGTLGVSITFMDVTRSVRLQEELRKSRETIQATNEELQSSNEELETTNEELQSTNEELETMNEELQSTNEELQTVNEELRQRTDEMNRLNSFLESVLAGLSSGAVVVNANFDVLMWNHKAEDMWGLRADEVQGKSLFGLDIGLPVAALRDVIRPCLSGDVDRREIVLEAVNRRGKKIRCRVACAPLVSAGNRREGVIALMDETP